MSKLHVKPTRGQGKVFDVTPDSANWSYVGFGLYKLAAGERVFEKYSINRSYSRLNRGQGKPSSW
jgi:5-deoxy-glucuronate isomerase